MKNFDETDLEILRLLAEDGRRPFNEVASAVDLSAPAVSDRVSKLEEQGIIRQFTIDIDRSQLRRSLPILVTVSTRPECFDIVKQQLTTIPEVEHIYATIGSDLVFYANAPETNPREWILAQFDQTMITEYEVALLTETDRSFTLSGTEFALSCAECGNTVTSEGVVNRVGGKLKQFCCTSCENHFTKRHDRLSPQSES
ncbi:winged helix-turn-helix transcriptional regulator [Natronosalvus caseinilyticus]|uniref:winged helix-turn-helix transcriptional regulator n=1 Tax=Natronosalvus caseinilyticus TaxID=2953747 RepID=UPI0028AA654B|nr:winged helix-turn-helix transcriptional regulator [Natronosalvus caseinilyticus]